MKQRGDNLGKIAIPSARRVKPARLLSIVTGNDAARSEHQLSPLLFKIVYSRNPKYTVGDNACYFQSHTHSHYRNLGFAQS